MQSKLIGLLLLFIFPSARAAGSFDLDFAARFVPDQGFAEASITVGQDRERVHVLDFRAPESRYFDFSGDGSVSRDGERVVWDVPKHGGTLHYKVRVDRQRGERFDARMTADTALVRLDHLFPSARVDYDEITEGDIGHARLHLAGPHGWHFETRYGSADKTLDIPPNGRVFVRPTGWLAAGRLSVRRDHIADRRIAIAGPLDERLRSLDLLALLRWNLPGLTRVLPELPDRLLIITAGDPMWRGGLSGPDSLYLHSGRPLISADGSSPPLHELIHVATRREALPGNDWIVEGLAEYYSIELLRRSRTVSESRHRKTMRRLAARADQHQAMLRSPSRGADTSRAALVFHDLDHELRKGGVKHGLDEVAGPLLQGRRSPSRARLLKLTEAALGHPSQTLAQAFERFLDPSAGG